MYKHKSTPSTKLDGVASDLESISGITEKVTGPLMEITVIGLLFCVCHNTQKLYLLITKVRLVSKKHKKRRVECGNTPTISQLDRRVTDILAYIHSSDLEHLKFNNVHGSKPHHSLSTFLIIRRK